MWAARDGWNSCSRFFALKSCFEGGFGAVFGRRPGLYMYYMISGEVLLGLRFVASFGVLLGFGGCYGEGMQRNSMRKGGDIYIGSFFFLLVLCSFCWGWVLLIDVVIVLCSLFFCCQLYC